MGGGVLLGLSERNPIFQVPKDLRSKNPKVIFNFLKFLVIRGAGYRVLRNATFA